MNTHVSAVITWVAGLLGSVIGFMPMIPAVAQPFVVGFGLLLVIIGQLLHIQGLHLDLQGHKIAIKGELASMIEQVEGALDLEPGDLMAGPTSQASASVTTAAPVVAPVAK